MYCASCGKQIANDAVFCGYCGKPTPQSGVFAELVARARTGNQDAVSALYEKTYSRVYYTVKSMIKDEDAVLDIVQDTYIKAFAHLDSFQGDIKFLPWVRQIAANTARDWLKKKRPMLFTELSSSDEQDTPVEELFPDERSENLPDQVIDQKETTRLIREIIEELPEDQRAAIGMFYYEEMSVKEIAAAMETSESAIKSRLMYGRNKIEKKVRELEKQGTKLYSLSPLPFLLLLFRNLDAYATQAPDTRILHAILALQSMGAATAAGAVQGAGMAEAAAGAEAAGTAGAEAAGTAGVAGNEAAGTAGVAAGTEAAGTAGATAGAEAAGAAATGTIAAAGSLGALKIGIIVVAAVAAVGLAVFGVPEIASLLAGHQEPPTFDVIDREEPETQEEPEGREESRAWNESDAREESKVREESEESKKPDSVDEALAQYRSIISQADSYEYGEILRGYETAGYRYALVQMQPDDPVPTLLVERGERDSDPHASATPSRFVARIFQYDPDTKTVRQPAETVSEGGPSSTPLSMAGDGYGMMIMGWGGGTGEGSVTRITLDGDSLKQDTFWEGRIDLRPESITFIDIEWHEVEDLSTLDGWTAPDSGETESAEPETRTEKENTSLLADYVGTYTPYELFHDYYGGGERWRDITLAESGRVSGGGRPSWDWNSIDINGLEPSEILQNEDGSIEIRFSGYTAVYRIYPAGVVPDGHCYRYTDDYWQENLDLDRIHIQYLNVEDVSEILYHN